MQKLSKAMSDIWTWIWVGLILVGLWYAWPHIGGRVRHATEETADAFGRLHFSPPPPADHSHHTYRSVPLRITFNARSADHDAYGHIARSEWGGSLGIPRECPTVSGAVLANGTRVHRARLDPVRTEPFHGVCALHWDVIVEYGDDSTILGIALDEHTPTDLIHNVRAIDGLDEPADANGTVRRPVVINGLTTVDGHPLSIYSHIRMRGGELFIEQTGPHYEAGDTVASRAP